MKHARLPHRRPFGPKLAVFAIVTILWLILDRITKIWANKVNPGDVLVTNIGGLFEFRLVHNTGAAWGIFSQSTFALGIFSVIVCLIILIFLMSFIRTQGTIIQTFALALVFAGGIGNAIDRITLGYVVDFINATFISFPVFNVADIGVTCGIVFLMLALFLTGNSNKQENTG